MSQCLRMVGWLLLLLGTRGFMIEQLFGSEHSSLQGGDGVSRRVHFVS
jgi:hypothetical protein